MSETRIEWTDRTWNPAVGCARVSPGCDHCYAARVASRNMTAAHAGLAKRGDWTGEVRLLPDRLDEPLRWRKPSRVFVGSMCDLFHPDVPDSFIVRVLATIYAAPHHTFQVLTKRPQRMADFMRRWADRSGDESAPFAVRREPDEIRAAYTSGRALLWAEHNESLGPPPEGCAYEPYDWMDGPRSWPEVPHNLWLGVTVENQRDADLRIPHLLATPAAVRFVSCEPLLGPIDLRTVPIPLTGSRELATQRLDWVIVGGETGPGARPMHPDWARNLSDECVAAGVPFFFKQWGEWAPVGDRTLPEVERIPAQRFAMVEHDGTVHPQLSGPATAEPIARLGKKAAGRVLDGRTHDDYPEARP